MRSLAPIILIVLLAGCVDTPHSGLASEASPAAILRLEDFSKAEPAQIEQESKVAEKDPSFESHGKAIDSTESRQDVKWGAIYIKADSLGVHYNINQAAKAADALADDWSLVFSEDAPFRAEDAVYFCAPKEAFGVQLLDLETSKLLFDGQVGGIQQCV